MEETLRKKINLLVNLAKSDGSIHVSEAAFLRDLLKEKGVDRFDFDAVDNESEYLENDSSMLDK